MIVPELVGEDEGVVSQASALLQGANRVTLLLGPPLAGVLIGLISAPALCWWSTPRPTRSLFFLLESSSRPPSLAAVGEEDRGFRRRLAVGGADPLFRAWRVT